MAKLRVWRVLLVVALFMTIILSPMAWQKYREFQRRQAAAENLRKLSQALIEYDRKKTAKESGAFDSEGTTRSIDNADEPGNGKPDDAE